MPKRAGHQNQHGKKKQKAYHGGKDNSAGGAYGSKSSFNVQPDMKGVLVMCTRGRENRAVKEALDILTRYGEELYPEDKSDDNGQKQTDGDEDEDEDEDEDLEASIAREVAAIKKPKGRKRFANITTGTDCVCFIRATPPVEPVKLVHYMLTDLNEKQQKTTRYISRYLPIEKACNADLADISASAKIIFAPHFSQKDGEGKIVSRKFAVACRVRNCTKLSRTDVINCLAASVGLGHQVDLNNPELTVIAEVCQNICMMSVVTGFNELKKYNIESILGINKEAPEEAKKNAEVVTEAEDKKIE